jgi:hypothetical protein
MPSRVKTPPTVRVFTNFTLSPLDIENIEAGVCRVDNSIRVLYNKSGRADLAVVVNFATGIKFAYGRGLQTLKWLMEPTINDRITHRFTHSHSRVFDLVYAHNASTEDPREVHKAPMIPPHVKVWPPEMLLARKSKLVSAIGSREAALPLHRIRTALLDNLEAESGSKVEVYGKDRRYIDAKSDGLETYMYSIAIENSTTPSYWTEKISDCFLSMTVPIYLGATNIEDYFPEGSFISLGLESLHQDLQEVLSQISAEDYASRIEALLTARQLILENYDFGVQIARIVKNSLESGETNFKIKRVWTSDTLLAKLVNMVRLVPQPLLSFIRRTLNLSRA